MALLKWFGLQESEGNGGEGKHRVGTHWIPGQAVSVWFSLELLRVQVGLLAHILHVETVTGSYFAVQNLCQKEQIGNGHSSLFPVPQLLVFPPGGGSCFVPTSLGCWCPRNFEGDIGRSVLKAHYL